MPINLLHHFTILTDDIETTAAFFVDALGFSHGYSPEPGFPVVWLYLDDRPVIHLVQRGDMPDRDGSARIDHVAFNCTDYAGVKARLDAHGAAYKEQTQPEISVHQIFVASPEEVWLELVFPIEDYRNADGEAAAPA